MKRALFYSVLLVGVFVFCLPVHAQGVVEHIEHFDSIQTIHADATVAVEERVEYVFADKAHHGIYRDIPTTYKTALGSKSIQLSNISVRDEKGQAYPFTAAKVGSEMRIKIGDPNTLVSGTKLYVLSYTVSRAMSYFDAHDEWYWNSTGSSWLVPILHASSTVVLPTTLATSAIKTSCSEGSVGSTTSCLLSVSKSGGVSVVIASARRTLSPRDGFAVAVGISKGVVAQPTKLEVVWQFLRDNIVAVLLVAAFFAMFWWRRWR